MMHCPVVLEAFKTVLSSLYLTRFQDTKPVFVRALKTSISYSFAQLYQTKPQKVAPCTSNVLALLVFRI